MRRRVEKQPVLGSKSFSAEQAAANASRHARILLGCDQRNSQGTELPADHSSTNFTDLEVLGDLADQALEGQLADEQLGGLLVLADLTQGHGAGPVAVGLLHAAGGRGRLAGGLGGQLLAGRLATGGLAGGLLGAGHGDCWC